ncbi:MAG: peptidylprolyl isomerase [Acidobacteriota bacterium]
MIGRTPVSRRRLPRRPGALSGPFAGAVLLAAGLAVVGGCKPPERAEPGVCVSISGEKLRCEAFDRYLASQLGQGVGNLDDAAFSGLFDQFLDGELLIRLAVERGLVEGPVDQRRAMAYLFRDARFDPSERELRAYFEAHRSDFDRPARVHLRLILVDERNLAEQALAALQDADFVEVAAQFSQGPTAHLGGDQGWLSEEDLSGLFGDVIFNLDINEVSEIVKADFGYQIFQVSDRQEATVMPFEDAEPLIREALQARFMDEQLASLLAEARERYNVRVFRGNFSFDYAGLYGADASSP